MASDVELDAYIDDVNDLRRRLGEAPLQLDSSEKSNGTTKPSVSLSEVNQPRWILTPRSIIRLLYGRE
jgi:hypothetical protein